MTARGIRLLPADASEDAWLDARRSGIGASEIAAVAGLSRRRGPWDVWSSKVDGTEFEPSDAMRWGQFIESTIVKWWARETGRWVGPGGLFQHPGHDWLIATPDAIVWSDLPTYPTPDAPDPMYDVRDPMAVVDAKNAGWHMGGDWDDDGAPVEYICQITWQMLAVGVSDGYLVAAIGGNPPTERHFTLDQDLAAALTARGAGFWDLVQTRTPPPLDGSAPAGKWLAARYADADPDATVDLNDDDVAALRQWLELDARIADLELAQKTVENAVKEHLGAASFGVYKGREFVTWKTVNRRGFSVEPTTFRKFTIPKKIKEELSPGGHD